MTWEDVRSCFDLLTKHRLAAGLTNNRLRMLVDGEPRELLVRESALSRMKTRLLSSSAARSIAVFVLLLAVVISLQVASGTYHAEFGGYPDEPAHYVTSLMLRDYIIGFQWGSPLQFALQYYHYYPKVAFGHWPPFFYIVQAIWMLLFSTSRASIRLEIACTTVLLGYSVYQECRRWFGGYGSAVLAGLLLVTIPLVQQYTDEEMSEMLLTFLCFWAAIFFARYLDSEGWQHNALFGVFFSLAVLTKGSGWLLAGLIPIALLLRRKFRLLTRWQFWIAPAIVGLLCVPWQLYTLTMAEQGWTETSHAGLPFTLMAIYQFSMILLRVAGWPLAVLALIGIFATVLAPALGRQIRVLRNQDQELTAAPHALSSGPAVMFALVICTIVFHAIVPAGIEDRKLLIAVPAWILFIFAGGFWLSDQLPLPHQFGKWRSYLVAAAAITAFALGTFSIPREKHYGFENAARYITSHPDLKHDTILVSDNSAGEGLLISEIAMHERRPGNVIIRGTKAFAQVDWAGSSYHSLYSTPQQITQAIDQLGVNLIVTDTFPGFRDLEHNQLLRAALRDTRRFQLIRSFEGDSPDGKGKVLIYKVNIAA